MLFINIIFNKLIHIHQNNEVFGCAKPFRLVPIDEEPKWKVEICDYI